MTTLRQQLEARERDILAPQAAKSADSKGRLRAEPEDDVRPAFQRDPVSLGVGQDEHRPPDRFGDGIGIDVAGAENSFQVRSQQAGVALFGPVFEAPGRLLQVAEEIRVLKALADCRHDRLRNLPCAEELARGLEEQIFVQQSVVEKRTSLFPVAEYHHYESAIFGSGSGNPHSVIKILYVVILEIPIAGLAELGLTSHFVKLQV